MKIIITILIILCIILLIYLFMIAPRMFNKPSRKAFMNTHYAHRGLFDNKSNAPENSIAAFRRALIANYGIEFDVQLSKDKIPVVFHDATLKRMCNVEGNVWDYTFNELKELRLADSASTIPSLKEVLATIDGRVPLIIEYKLDVPNTLVCEISNELLKEYKGPYCIECFHPYALMWYRKNRKDIVRGQLCMEYYKEDEFKGHFLYRILAYLLTNCFTRPDFISYRHQDSSNLSRRLCRLLGALSVAWTVQSKKEYEKVQKEFDLFIFDSFIL